MSSEKGMTKVFIFMFVLMGISMLIVFMWESVPIIKNSVHYALDPSAGILLNWDIFWGMTFLVLLIAFLTTIVQKYLTDQKTLRELKEEQKELQKEIKQYSGHPEKMLELNKKSFALMSTIMSLTMKGTIFTMIPFILLFRWFMDFFVLFPDFRFFGFLNWYWFYLIFVIIFSSILRKILKVV